MKLIVFVDSSVIAQCVSEQSADAMWALNNSSETQNQHLEVITETEKDNINRIHSIKSAVQKQVFVPVFLQDPCMSMEISADRLYLFFSGQQAEFVKGSAHACAQHAARSSTGGHFVFLQ